jgi:hypothetical protein
MSFRTRLLGTLLAATTSLGALTVGAALVRAQAQETTGSVPTIVTPDNFARAESDLYFGRTVDEVGLGKFAHNREPTDVNHQTVIRMNRDTLYSFGVFDLDAGPVTITLPDAGERFMSLMPVSQDHYVNDVYHGAGAYMFSKDEIGTRYVTLAIRTLVDPDNPTDVADVHRLQDAVVIEQPGGPGTFEVGSWDKASQDKVRTALLELAATLPDLSNAFGKKDEVDEVHHLIASAAGWGGNPDSEATYVSGVPPNDDGTVVYTLKVPADVPVDGFWSITLYNAEGYMVPNDLNAYSVNNVTADKAADGSVTVQFGGCDGNVPNCLPTTDGWNYLVRLYRPRAEILDGSWRFPEAQPAG